MNLKKTLKPFKKKLQNQEIPFKTIRRVYPHLDALNNEEILDYYHVTSIKELEVHIECIKEILIKKLQNYKEELDEIEGCFCMDSNEEFKYLYSTKKEASTQVEYSFKIKRIKLQLYSCPYGCGWHLTRI